MTSRWDFNAERYKKNQEIKARLERANRAAPRVPLTGGRGRRQTKAQESRSPSVGSGVWQRRQTAKIICGRPTDGSIPIKEVPKKDDKPAWNICGNLCSGISRLVGGGSCEPTSTPRSSFVSSKIPVTVQRRGTREKSNVERPKTRIQTTKGPADEKHPSKPEKNTIERREVGKSDFSRTVHSKQKTVIVPPPEEETYDCDKGSPSLQTMSMGKLPRDIKVITLEKTEPSQRPRDTLAEDVKMILRELGICNNKQTWPSFELVGGGITRVVSKETVTDSKATK